MADLQMDAELITGIDLIDAQHRALVAGVDRLAAACAEGASEQQARELLAVLAQGVVKHFQTEERLMKEMAYPGLGTHAAQHLALILQVRGIQYRFLRGDALNAQVTRFLADWFIHHIKEVDMDYVAFRKAQDAPAGEC